jgi:hypothetical protein
VVLIEPTPFKAKFDPLACLSEATVVEQCRYVAPAEPSDIEQLYRRLDKQYDDVWSLDLDHIVCPYFPICDPIVNHQVTKPDVSHFTRSFMRTLAPAIDAYFKQNGIIPDERGRRARTCNQAVGRPRTIEPPLRRCESSE